MVFLLFGSSASGKTTLVHDVVPLVDRLQGHDFDEIAPPPGADTAWRHRTYRGWVDRALELQEQHIDLLLCGQTPFGELLAAPRAHELEAISACLIDCDDVTRAGRLDERGEPWFERSAGPLMDTFTWPEWVQNHLRWADWLRRHACDPTWMPHVIRIPETANEMNWARWQDWSVGDYRWRVHTIDTTARPRERAASDLATWIGHERNLFEVGAHPLVAGWAHS
ncbi:MAG TPA: hypothetical protein VLJ44_10665 [Gaiellaceae bacterium]|nr:hypothetical protein [Gaiellaceae bacterium]